MKIEDSVKDFLSRRIIPMRLSCMVPAGFPLVLSLWYYFDGDYIYAITGKSSKLYRYLMRDGRVGFEIAGDKPPYCGVRGYGKVNLIDDNNKEMTKHFYSRYFMDTDTKLFQFLTRPTREEIIIKINPMTIYTWNFEERMRDTRNHSDLDICP